MHMYACLHASVYVCVCDWMDACMRVCMYTSAIHTYMLTCVYIEDHQYNGELYTFALLPVG